MSHWLWWKHVVHDVDEQPVGSFQNRLEEKTGFLLIAGFFMRVIKYATICWHNVCQKNTES